MKAIEHALKLLACPNDLKELTSQSRGLVCTSCRHQYPTNEGIVHFVSSEDDRPANPKALAKDYAEHSPNLLHVDYYRFQATQKEQMYQTNPAVKSAVDFILANGDAIVDLATGHSGSYIVPIVRRLASSSILIATDACQPVIENWHAYLAPQYSDRFLFFDIDLEKKLSFSDEAVDVFTGLLISNVNGGNPDVLLREVHRCLKPSGFAVFQEMFFADQSATAQMLERQGNMYASLTSFTNYSRSIGLETVRTDSAINGVGKICPGDGLPINDLDQWSQTIVYLRKL